ncbi:MAG: hypothetical protein GF403_04490 [Candidatus Coatesbacteria bacterium]|nr:hypothetical protein [Candidatus Coatesbacteria bacterium]
MLFFRKWLRVFTRYVLEGPARVLARLRVEPTTLTVSGLLVSLGAGWTVARGELTTTAWLLLLSGFFDMVDGQVARLREKSGPAGALTDSLIDRLSDGAVMVGVIYLFALRGETWYLLAAAAALVLSGAVSYIKARAENYVDDCAVGFWQRPERLVLLVLGCFFGYTYLRIAVVVLAVGALGTTLRRFIHALGRLDNQRDGQAAPDEGDAGEDH